MGHNRFPLGSGAIKKFTPVSFSLTFWILLSCQKTIRSTIIKTQILHGWLVSSPPMGSQPPGARLGYQMAAFVSYGLKGLLLEQPPQQAQAWHGVSLHGMIASLHGLSLSLRFPELRGLSMQSSV